MRDVGPGFTLLVGFGLFFGTAYVLTRKEEASRATQPTGPVPAPSPVPAPLAPASPTPAQVPVQAPIPPPALVQAAPTPRSLVIVEPPDPVVARTAVPVTIPTLDANLTLDEIDAVAYALARETDPSLLQEFASTFLPDYPVTGSLLLAKAKLLTSPSTSLQVKAAIDNAVRQPVTTALRQVSSSMTGGSVCGPCTHITPEVGSVSIPLEGADAVRVSDAYERGMDHVIESILLAPDLGQLSTADLANRLGVPGVFTQMATDTLRDVGGGTYLVDPGTRQTYRDMHVSEDSYGSRYAAAKRDALERFVRGEAA